MREIANGVYGLSPKKEREEALELKKKLSAEGKYEEAENVPDRLPMFWHNCEKYKDRPLARVELFLDEDSIYKCRYCGFEYNAN